MRPQPAPRVPLRRIGPSAAGEPVARVRLPVPARRALAAQVRQLARACRERRRVMRETSSGAPPILPDGAHPNELDLRRIGRSLDLRRRYRYVTPRVHPAQGGYRIESPCCSRNVASDGATIDIAWLQYDGAAGHWRLHRRDHLLGTWVLEGLLDTLPGALEVLNDDPARVFWP